MTKIERTSLFKKYKSEIEKRIRRILSNFVWANGFGTIPGLWFDKPEKFKLVLRGHDFVMIYVPENDTKSSEANGGLWIHCTDKMNQMNVYGDCITYFSTSYKNVNNFTKIAANAFKTYEYAQFLGHYATWKYEITDTSATKRLFRKMSKTLKIPI